MKENVPPNCNENEQVDLGLAALRRIARLWQVDADRITWIDDGADLGPGNHGFDWWPGSFQVTLRSQKSVVEEHGEAWRLIARTAFLKDVTVEDAKTQRLIAQMSSFAPTYGWVYTPVQIAERYKIDIDRTLRFQSTMYLREDTAGWLPEFFGRLAILQPIDAQRLADITAKILGGHPDLSVVSEAGGASHLDEILHVAESIYAPLGQQPSRWAESEEFASIAERFGKDDLCFGMGGPDGLSLETPIGSSSALIRLLADQPHPGLGTGLLATLQLPFGHDEVALTEDCMWLNFFESVMWSDVPQLGSWHPKRIGEDGCASANAWFFPNALYGAGVATNAAMWQVWHARWAKQQLWPNLEDLTMTEVLERRFASMKDSSQ